MNYYLLFKSLHLIAVISWMAGLLYLPRIFVYHVENYQKKETTEIFETMERKLYFYIMRPAMLISWLFGILLIYQIGFESFSQLWLQLKIFFVIILTVYHEYLGKCLTSLRDGSNSKSSRFFRIINEIPTILLILIVFIVIFKPI
ncbi:protoporphyrinogen oxidase HemJ [Candidatus Pelagibacter sp. RS40]|jgi:putative membrane protein|uniref:protoporphyrinogen oxidase HemJ n=1 Tax=Candidatus Pelagibacter sp. RS40 TaxID=1977865 RepID=UPI000A16451C|nr:protoporphyrinogen oxidase HemJ [Candidatus Pelagibacter sp. RS40]ARJ49063.1 TIGR00701 family protein [Candidatus Pelagibacter sp. RS40]MDC3025993.1 protoporphyrinogen oxidase HemJ [Candidatus Pelagibacter sp.]